MYISGRKVSKHGSWFWFTFFWHQCQKFPQTAHNYQIIGVKNLKKITTYFEITKEKSKRNWQYLAYRKRYIKIRLSISQNLYNLKVNAAVI